MWSPAVERRYGDTMLNALLASLGGLGLFLFGMNTMTDGLKGLAGGSLRRALAKFTRSPSTGALTGAVGTAIIQSSSATTIIALGFVGAGLMTFPQALGVVFGANIGTTATGWLVGLVGFKLGLLSVLWPVIFIGALLVMFGHDRVKAVGRALVGFGMVFVGLAYLKDGLSGFDLTPDSFPDDTWGGRTLLVLLGLGITLITQSSSAGVAAAMAAVLAGTIALPQAAAMVIGMDVGTTITAVVAAIGSNVAGRRTAAAHVVYNLCTGVAGFLALPAYFALWAHLGRPGADDPQLVLVAFHSLFNIIGVVIVLPLTGPFARLIERLVPDRAEGARAALPRRLLSTPAAALDVIARLTAEHLALSHRALSAVTAGERPALAALDDDLTWLRAALVGLADAPGQADRRLAALHVVDHLERLGHRLTRPDAPTAFREDGDLRAWAAHLGGFAADAAERWSTLPPAPDVGAAEQIWIHYRDRHAGRRRAAVDALLGEAADEADRAARLERRLDGERWLMRCAHHVWRAEAWWAVLGAEGSPPDDSTG